MHQQNSMAGEVGAEWERLKEQWRRGRASAPTRRDLALAWQEKQAADAHAAESDASLTAAEREASSVSRP